MCDKTNYEKKIRDKLSSKADVRDYDIMQFTVSDIRGLLGMLSDCRAQIGASERRANEFRQSFIDALNNHALHTPPADAALADAAIIELVTDYAQSKVRAESCRYHYESKEYDKEAADTLEQIRAALSARAVPDEALDLLRKVATSDVMSDRSGVMFVHLAIDRDVIDDINAMLAASKEAK